MEDTHPTSPDSSPKRFSHPPKSHRKITPPERKSLPSPPASGERNRASTADELPQSLVEFKRKVETAGDVSPLTSFHLSKADFTRLHAKLEAHFRRFDYEPRHQRIIFRMPSRTHDHFAQFIYDDIFNAISEHARDSEQVRSFSANIKKAGTADIILYDSDDKSKDPVPLKRSPDAQFLYVDTAFPSVVVEVAYSQDGKQLSKIAKQYIHYSDGNIKAVLCFDLNKGSESTISVWKPRFIPEQDSDEFKMEIEQVVQSQPFRTADGSPINQDHALVLDLHDFALDELCEGYPNPSISIPYSKLYDSLVMAERLAKSVTTGMRSKRGVKRGRLSTSSVESMTSEDKKKWKDNDHAVKKKQNAEDGEYEGVDDGASPAKKRAQLARQCTRPSVLDSDSDSDGTGVLD
ncbi:hypothetical protein FOQG_19455 [Fusarium oxysporum f. sp. raphani 54005]|uniref:Uncharacterized protein n=2 Tax=Fusarium oxysporum f. sp. raphani TaxID=96318 RepID=X0B0Z9_FUSOX|nr:hypothetical protein FOQG_19455 [Fusarium oxysporum f. sp. raphani 54005]KAG7405788.1 hypothetical protein Forpi1262_v018302 [Fusarium oxysporum f. sp. raphani]